MEKLLILLTLLSASLPQSPQDSLGLHLYDLAEEKYAEKKFQESVYYGEKALPLLRKHSPETVADCLSILSIAAQQTGDFNKALEYQRECYQLDLASGDQANISSSLNNLAGLYLAMEDCETASEMIHKAIDIERSLPGTQALCIRLGMASDIDLQLGRTNEALEHSAEAYALDKAAGREEKAAIRLSQMAAVYIETGRNDEAKKCLQEAITVFREDGNAHSLSVCYNQLGDIALEAGDRREAENNFRSAVQLALQTGNRYIERKARRGLARSLGQTNPAAALKELERYTELTDTMFSEESSRLTGEFKVKYNLAEKEHELQMQSQKVRTRNTLLTLSALLVILLIVIILILVRAQRLRKKNYQMLERANELKDRLLALNKAASENEGQAIREIAEQISAIGADSAVHLTAREIEVVKYCCEGLISKEIADKMGISQRTVDSHKNNIFRKLGINTTVELVGYAHRAGLL